MIQIKKRCISAGIVIAAAVILYLLIHMAGQPHPPLQTAGDGTSVSAAYYTDLAFEKQLQKTYPDFYRSLSDDPENKYIIPGLKRSVSIPLGESEPAVCRDMTPQGIAVTDKYIFVSAYSHSGKFHSVLYMIDKKTGSYIKTIVLQGAPHAGGIAYAPESGGLWVATNHEVENRQAQISLIAMRDIEAYDVQKMKAPIAYKYRVNLEELPAISSISYYDHNLIAGYFRQGGHADMVRYTLKKDGTLKLPYFNRKAKKKDKQSLSSFYSYRGMESMQGLCINHSYVYISQSFGIKNSNLLLMKNNGIKSWADFDDDEIDIRVESPSYMEQIVCDDKYIYLLFEACATPYYSRNTSMHMDRIVKLSADKVEKLN